MAGLLRYQIFLSYGIIILALWYTLIQNKSSIITKSIGTFPIFSSLPICVQEGLIDYLPLWLLVCLGFYAIGSIGYGVAILADCPEAAKEVEKQIKEAKEDMKKRGIIDE